MGAPFGMWGMMPPQMFSMPNILPSSSYVPSHSVPLTCSMLNSNPAGAIRDFTEHVISGYRDHMAPPREMKIIEDWIKNEEYRKVVLEVVKARLELGWPYNYKALDVLSLMSPPDLLPLLDIITKLNESPAGTEGGPELKKLAKPLVDKAKAEQAKQKEEASKKQQEAIAAMWGGLWHNAPSQAPMHAAGWGWGYPWAGPPGVAAAPGPAWNGTPPEGWTPWVLTPVPRPSSPVPPVLYGGFGGYGGYAGHGYAGYAGHGHGGFQRWPHEKS